MSGSIGGSDMFVSPHPVVPTIDRLHTVMKQARAQGDGTQLGQSLLSAVNAKLAPKGDQVTLNRAISDVNTVLSQTAAQFGGTGPQLAFPTNAATLTQDVATVTQGLAQALNNGNATRDAAALAGNAVSDLAGKGINLTRGIAGSIVNQTVAGAAASQNQSPALPPTMVDLVG